MNRQRRDEEFPDNQNINSHPKPMLTKEQLQERALLVRIHEGNCGILFPNASEVNFRIAIMKRIAADFNLKELKAATLAQGKPTSPPVAPGR